MMFKKKKKNLIRRAGSGSAKLLTVLFYQSAGSRSAKLLTVLYTKEQDPDLKHYWPFGTLKSRIRI